MRSLLRKEMASLDKTPCAEAFDGPTADIDRPEEETVFLAPVRDFNPGGSSPGDGKSDDIKSPFAEGGTRQPPAAHDRLTRPIEQLSFERTEDEDELTAASALTLPSSETLPDLVPFQRLLDDDDDEEEDEDEPFFTEVPPVPKPEPARPTLIVPTAFQTDGAKELATGRNDAGSIEDEPPEPGLPEPQAAETRPEEDELSFAAKAPVAADVQDTIPPPSSLPEEGLDEGQAEPVEPEVAAPSAPPRWRTGLAAAVTVTMEGLARAGRASTKGMSRGWLAYSAQCAKLEASLSRLVSTALVQARRSATAAGAWLARALWSISVTTVRLAGKVAGRLVRAAAHFASAALATLTPMVISGTKTAFGLTLSATSSAKALVNKGATAARGAAVAAWQGFRARRSAAKAASKAAATSSASSAPASSSASVSSASISSAWVSSAAATSSPAKPAETEPPKTPAASPQESSSRPAEVSGTILKASARSLGATVRGCFQTLSESRSRAALAALGAASVALFIVSVSSTLIPKRVEAERIVPIPDRPSANSDVVLDLETPVDAAALSPARTEEQVIVDIITNINDPFSAAWTESGNPSLLAKVEGIEGLDRFVQAARTVGLDQLLKADQSYTIFAPNDAAFAKLGADEMERLFDPSAQERLLTLLSHHIVPERVTRADLEGDPEPFESMADRALAVEVPSIVEADFAVEDSVLHVVDRILLLPENPTP